MGGNSTVAFLGAALARDPFPLCLLRATARRVARTTPPLRQTPNPHGRCLTPHARGRAPGCVAIGPLWGQGRLRPGSFVDTGLHLSMVAAIPVWARSATGPDPRRAHPRTESARRPLRPAGRRANAPQRVEIGASQLDSLHPAPGRGSLGSSLRDSVVGNPHNSFKIRAEQIRLRIRSEKNQT